MPKLYLLHFDPAYHHARHYLGYTSGNDVSQRVHAHLVGRGSPLVAAAIAAGCTIHLAWTGEGSRDLERLLKRRKNGTRLCPVCLERLRVAVERALTDAGPLKDVE